MVELVIVMVVLGILALAIIPRFQDVTGKAKLNTFHNNCKIVGVAIAIYQASHDGELPNSTTDISPNIGCSWEDLENNPTGAHYSYTDGVFSAEYTDEDGNTHYFTFPE